jgi:hypothetical protein
MIRPKRLLCGKRMTKPSVFYPLVNLYVGFKTFFPWLTGIVEEFPLSRRVQGNPMVERFTPCRFIGRLKTAFPCWPFLFLV